MSEEYTSEELKRLDLQAMGAELEALFHCLSNECSWLYWKWGNYVALFGTSPERVSLLNQVAPAFFNLAQDALWEDLLLHVCRLTDPPRSSGRETLTLRRLPSLVPPAIRPEVDRLLSAAVLASSFARDWRNRHIAHRDLRLALSESATALATASRANVKTALNAIAAVLNCIDRHCRNTTVAYDLVIAPLGDAEALVCVLRDGLTEKD